MSRPVGWEQRLAAYMAERREMAFQWGEQDCCRFACGGLVAQGLPDPMRGVRPYKTARGAAGAIKRLGGSLDEAATRLAAKISLNEMPPAFAQRGSPVLADIETPWETVEPALGLVDLDGGRAWFAGAEGLVWRPLRGCRRAWVV